MRIELENTGEVVEIAYERQALPGTPCRVWRGRTANGTPIHALIALVAVERTEDTAPFERELAERKPTADAPRVFPSRLVL